MADADEADDRRSYGATNPTVRIASNTKDLRNSVGSDFMSISIKILNQTVIGPLVWNEKRRSNFTSVRIPSLACIEKRFKDFIVNIIDRILECDEN